MISIPILITIPVVPVSWKSHAGYGRKSWNPRYEEKEYYVWEIKKQYAHNLPITVAVAVEYRFFLPIPSSVSAVKRGKMLASRVHHIKRPDVSNLVKFAEDTLKELVIKDDSQVIKFTACKLYSETPRTEIEITLA